MLLVFYCHRKPFYANIIYTLNPILKLYIPFNQLHGIYSLSPICVPGYRKALDQILYYKNALPCGSPPPLGERLFQKIE